MSPYSDHKNPHYSGPSYDRKLLNWIFIWTARALKWDFYLSCNFSILRYINNLTYDKSIWLWFMKECTVGFIPILSTKPSGNFNTYLESIIS
jgi:hypothetical protein